MPQRFAKTESQDHQGLQRMYGYFWCHEPGKRKRRKKKKKPKHERKWQSAHVYCRPRTPQEPRVDDAGKWTVGSRRPRQVITSSSRCFSPEHDDVIKWKHFPRHWPFCAGNSPVTGEFPSQRPVTRSFGVFFDLRLNKRLSKQSWGWWFETPSRCLWRDCNDIILGMIVFGVDCSLPSDRHLACWDRTA